jgi:alkaline phosphatase D
VPENLHFDSNPRVGDPVVVPTGPFSIVAHVPSNLMMPPQGAHGYDPDTIPSMKAIFYAAGPEIRSGLTVAPFENIHLYPLIAKILGLQIGPVDGQLRVLQGVLKKPSAYRRRRARK